MKKIYLFLLFFIIFYNIAYSQIADKKVKPQCRYNYLQLTVGAGFTRPTEIMADSYNTSANFGFDLSWRVNPEVAVFFESRYNVMSLVDSVGPTTGFLQNTFGTRFYFTSKNVRSSFFVECSVGPYFKFRGSYIDSTNHQSNSVTEVRLGANAGVGGELVFTDNFYFTIKARYHSLFGIGGLISYIDGFGGFTVRL
jgi:hypothetical protein